MLLQGTSRAHERQHHKRDVQNLTNNVRNVSENLIITSLQKTCLLGTARILRKALSI